MNRFSQLITFLTSSVFCNLYATSDELRSPITFGPIRYDLPENVTKNNDHDILNELIYVVNNSFSIQEETFNSEGIVLQIVNGSSIELHNPSINKTAEDDPLLSVYLINEMILIIVDSISTKGTWVLPQNWREDASSRYKQSGEFFLKSGQKAYIFEAQGAPDRYIVSKLEKDDMSRHLYLYSDESGFGKALELAKSLEYSKSGFEQVEDLSDESQVASSIDNLISTPVDLDRYEEDGPFSVKFTKARKFKILHPYAEVGPNVYGAYKTEMSIQGIQRKTSYKIFAHYPEAFDK